MIAALARAGLALDEPRYRDAAVGAAAFLKRSLTEENGHLLARWRAGQAAHPGKLDDYAFCAWGLLGTLRRDLPDRLSGGGQGPDGTAAGAVF